MPNTQDTKDNMNDSIFISAFDAMPGDSVRCLFYIKSYIELKDEYKCDQDCNAQINLFCVTSINYSDNNESVDYIKNCIFKNFSFLYCNLSKEKRYWIFSVQNCCRSSRTSLVLGT